MQIFWYWKRRIRLIANIQCLFRPVRGGGCMLPENVCGLVAYCKELGYFSKVSPFRGKSI